MLQLSPSESFPIVRVLRDHTDTTTRYVQAVIRDAVSDALIATVNLDDKGSRRFSKVWKVTSDNTYSQGKYIVITTTVYDDSGYTSKSLNYQEEAETYVVQQRWNPTLGMGGGGVIDERTIKKVVEDVFGSQKPIKQEFPKTADFPMKELVNLIDEKIKLAVDSIPKQEKPEKIDLSLIEKMTKSEIASVLKSISKIPEPKETDIKPILKEISKSQELLAGYVKDSIETIQDNVLKSNKKELDMMVGKILEAIINGIKNGDVKFSLFGDGVPFDNSKEKRKNYIEFLTSQFNMNK